MKKRRVLALLLALSMTLGSNGIMTLAAEDTGISAAEETVQSEENGSNESNVSEEGESEDNAASGDTVKTESGSTETASGEDGEAGSGEAVSGEESETGSGETVSGEDGETGSGETVSEEESEAGNGETISGETEGADMETGEDEVASDDDAEGIQGNADQAVDTAVGEAEPEMYTFIDETGMSVTYDLNAEAGYVYTVEAGVLTKVTKADGSALSGTVELKQQEGENVYTKIGENIFNNTSGIEYVILPDGVTTIGEKAFFDYTGLKGITMPATVTSIEAGAFQNCTNLTQLSVPKAVTSIGDNAFSGDSSLYMVYIKDVAYSKMLNIGRKAFYACRRLEKFGSDEEFVLPGYLETIGESAFEGCRAIKKVVLPDSVKDKVITTQDPATKTETTVTQYALGESVFRNCTGLTDVVLSGAKTITKYAFAGCVNLLSVTFASGNETIDEYAFSDCSRLGEVKFSYTVKTIENYAFSNCTALRYAEFNNPEAKIASEGALPNENAVPLWVRGYVRNLDEVCPSGYQWVKQYADDHDGIEFIENNGSTKEEFAYKYQCLTEKAGKVTLYHSDKETEVSEVGKSGGKKVKAGETIYVTVQTTASVKLVEGSLRYNGIPMSGPDEERFYSFKMPVGGAYVTAEFESTGKDENKNIQGTAKDVAVHLSNGSDLKVGQTTKMFLTDTSAEADNSVIPASKITFASNNKAVAAVSKDGTIKALKEGTAHISAELYDRNGELIRNIGADITVAHADVYKLRLKPSTYDTNAIIVDKNADDSIYGVTLKTKNVEVKGTEFTLLATAYDSTDDNMSVALKWSSSDSSVARLAKSKTDDGDSRNTVTIPKGASGEANIKVTATNTDPLDEDNKTVTCEFKVRVMDETPRLLRSDVTLNPYRTDGVVVELISAYNTKINGANVELRKGDDKASVYNDFALSYIDSGDVNSSVLRFNLTARNANIKDGNYNASIYVRVGDNYKLLPLTIRVKHSIPEPKVKFSSKVKMNLFYRDGGAQIVPIISNLGDAEVTSYALENISKSGDNAKFTENFEIDPVTGVITRSDNEMAYDKKNKPVVTGNLVLRFDNFKESYNEKKIKITIPVKTTKPSYKLERKSDTFNPAAGTQTVELALLDGKTKKPVFLDSAEWSVEVLAASATNAVTDVDITAGGALSLEVNPNMGGGKAVLGVKHDNWDTAVEFNYTVKISNKKTTFKLSRSSVTMNKYFAGEQTEALTLKSSQYGIEPESVDFEMPENVSEAKEEQYGKISVGYDSAAKKVSVGLTDSDIRNGSYKFICYPLGEDGNKVTLTVKITGKSPKLSLKGSASLNKLAAGSDTAALAINIKNLPANCELDAEGTTGSIVSVGRGEDAEDFSSYFDWSIEDNKLKISLSDESIASKTYSFKMTPAYTGYTIDEERAPTTKFKVKVYSGTISVSLKQKGKLNLLERYDETYYSPNSGSSEDIDTAAFNADFEDQNYMADGPDADFEGKAVTFVHNGKHVSVKTVESDTEVGDSDITNEDGYSFVVEAAEGYGADVKVYAKADYDADPGKAQPLETTPSVDGNKTTYSIAAEKITEDIIVVVTEKYTVTVVKDGSADEETVTELKCSINGGDYNEYSDAQKPEVEYGNSMSIQFKIPEGKLSDKQKPVVEINTEDKASVIAADSEPVEGVYTYTVENITDAVNVKISVETAHTVTLPGAASADKPEHVSQFAYAVVDDETGIDKAEFSDYSDKGMDAWADKKLALKITVESANYVVRSVKYKQAQSIAMTVLNDIEKELKPVKIDGLDYYFLIDMAEVTSDIELSVDIEEVYVITLVKNGSHFKVSAIDQETSSEITGNTDKVSKETAYKFTVEADEGYGVTEPKAYTTDSYGTTSPENVDITATGDNKTYTIEADKIKGDITIVITNTYKVELNDAAAGTPADSIENLSYKIGTAETYTDYVHGNGISVEHGQSLSFKVKPKESKNVAALDAEGHILSPVTGTTADEAVYTLDTISDNTVITLSGVKKITEEIVLDTDSSIINKAKISYEDNIVEVEGGKAVLDDKDLVFKVTPLNGYKVTEVSYRLKGNEAAAEQKLTADNQAEAETAGYYQYTISKANITDDLTIVVKTAPIDADNYIIEFDVKGAKVGVNEAAPTDKPDEVKFAKTSQTPRTFTFTVTPTENNILRYVGTDENLIVPSNDIINGPDENGKYTFTLPETPEPVTTVYISATPKATGLSVSFAGLADIGVDGGVTEKAHVSIVTFSEDKSKITTSTVPSTGLVGTTYEENDKVYFMAEPAEEHTISGITADNGIITSDEYNVIVDGESAARSVIIYTLDLANVYRDITVTVSAPKIEYYYNHTLKNSIVFTPVVANLKDTVTEAQIYDADGKNPTYEDEQSKYFNVEVIDGLLYVTPKEDTDEAVLKNKTAYKLKVWVKFENYAGEESIGGGVWVKNLVNIKTSQVLPKVVVDSKTPLNLYQSNKNYTASFVVTLKDGAAGMLEGIEFGENDEKAKESFIVENEIQKDGSLKVTLSLSDSVRYAGNSTNKIKMYVRFKGQAQDTTGRAITMTVKINK